MEVFKQIFEIDSEINALEVNIRPTLLRLEALKVKRALLEQEALGVMSEVKTLKHDGILWGKEKGRESVVLKTKDVPAEYCVPRADKRLILRTYRKNPEAIAPFAEVVRSPEKLTYEVF